MTSQEIKISSCSTQVVVNGSRIIGCPLPQETSDRFELLQYQSIDVQAKYSPSSSSGTFHQCLWFQQNGKIFFYYFEEIEERNSFEVIEFFPFTMVTNKP